MKKNGKIGAFLTGMLAGAALLGCTAAALAAGGSVTFGAMGLTDQSGVTVAKAGDTLTNGSGQEIPVTILYTDGAGGGNTYVPIRVVSELLGVPVDWEGNMVYLGGKPEKPAVTPDTTPVTDISGMTTEQVAHLSTGGVSPEIQDAILAARAEIIYGSQAWTVGGTASIINADGSVEKIPEFSDLFPGWEVPEANWTDATVANSAAASKSGFPYQENVNLRVANAKENAQRFFSFVGAGEPIYVFASTTPCNGAKFNVGFSNDNGENLGWVPNVTKEQQVKFEAAEYIYYHVCASVSNAGYAGWYRMEVTKR